MITPVALPSPEATKRSTETADGTLGSLAGHEQQQQFYRRGRKILLNYHTYAPCDVTLREALLLCLMILVRRSSGWCRCHRYFTCTVKTNLR